MTRATAIIFLSLCGLAQPLAVRAAASAPITAPPPAAVTTTNQAATVPPATWTEQMLQLSHAFSNAFPFIYSPKELSAPENKAVIQEYITRLKSSAHTFPVEQGKVILGDELMVRLLPQLMLAEIKAAESGYLQGNYSAAHTSFKKITNQCFSCHILYPMGAQVKGLNSEIAGFSAKLREKINALVALRQFEAAQNLLKKELTRAAQSEKTDVEDIKLYLLIAILVGEPPTAIVDTLSAITAKLNNRHASKALIQSWASNLAAPRNPQTGGPNTDYDGMLRELSTLTEQLRDEANYVKYLLIAQRLAGTAHSPSLSNENIAKRYLALGITYQGINVPEFFMLPWMYFEASALKVPKTELAKQGYDRATSYLLGYFKKKSISELPNGVQKRLNSIR